MFALIWDNIEWIFSGIGVLLVGFIVNKFLHKKTVTPLEEEPQPDTETSIHDNKGIVVIGGINNSTISYTEEKDSDTLDNKSHKFIEYRNDFFSFKKMQYFVDNDIWENYLVPNYSNNEIVINVNFNGSTNKDFTPRYGGAYIKFRECMDIGRFRKICFTISSPENTINAIYFECKSFSENQMSQTKIAISDKPKKVEIPLADIETNISLNNIGEFTFAIYNVFINNQETKEGILKISDFILI